MIKYVKIKTPHGTLTYIVTKINWGKIKKYNMYAAAAVMMLCTIIIRNMESKVLYTYV